MTDPSPDPARQATGESTGQSTGQSSIEITRNDDEHRYEARVDGELAGVSTYQLTDQLVVFTHTEVDDRCEGMGIGSALVRHALDEVAAEGLRQVLPLCPFVSSWIAHHGEYQHLVYGAPPSTAKD